MGLSDLVTRMLPVRRSLGEGGRPRPAQEKSSRAGPMIAWSNVGAPKWTPRRMSSLAEEGFRKNVVAYRCVMQIAASCAAVPWLLYDEDGNELDQHPLLDLLAHTRTVRSGMVVTQAQADQLLDEDLQLYERAVSRLVSVPLNDNQFSALVCFAFNVGIGNFESSTLLKLLNRGWYEQVPAQLMRWNRANGEVFGGLARRRAAEARLWSRNIAKGDDGRTA